MSGPIVVSGLGRCGTSLVMQMLAAGGIECHGPFPAYEPEDVGMGRDVSALLRLSKPFKMIDPHRDAKLPSLKQCRVIWLDRDYEEQAKSQVKMVETFGGFHVPQRRKAIRAIQAQLRRDRAVCLDRLEEADADLWETRFETILAMPWAFAHDLHGFLGQDFDEAKAAGAVIARHPACMPDMNIEIALCEKGDQ